MVVNLKKKPGGLSLRKLQIKIGKLGFKLSSINDLLATNLITFDEWKKAHDRIIDKYLKTWNEISRCHKKNNKGGEHEQES